MRITLEETTNISHVGGLKTQLAEALSADEAIELDASEVVRVDAALLQLLASFSMQADAQGQSVSWVSPSEGLVEAARLTGLQGVLKLV